MTRFVTAGLLAATLAAASHAQQQTPPSWRVAPDQPVRMLNAAVVSDSTLWFVTMAPGWHVTMGPGGALYDPRYIAEGRFDAETEFFIFPNAANAGTGLFLGGRDLDGANRTYTAFEVRRDGSYGVFRHTRQGTETIVPWTTHAVVNGPEKNGGKNAVRVSMDSAGVHLTVNGTRLRSWPHGELSLDGQFGLRVGRLVNQHVTRLDLAHRLAPVPSGR